ncbi:hypothetical protein FHS21_002311 [Phyllobacterium trifolii]|jgi:hypothetical protein|uniref:Uncharacterized protein n=1 Tax=Phyllobacterium trifolii TaxID=300193 RepID=A0A839U5Z1_9HYPH|nr:hypothetical protein [Phyllobacterium trifolii]
MFFTVGNATKAVPWLLLVNPTSDVWTLMAICLLACRTSWKTMMVLAFRLPVRSEGFERTGKFHIGRSR